MDRSRRGHGLGRQHRAEEWRPRILADVLLAVAGSGLISVVAGFEQFAQFGPAAAAAAMHILLAVAIALA